MPCSALAYCEYVANPDKLTPSNRLSPSCSQSSLPTEKWHTNFARAFPLRGGLILLPREPSYTHPTRTHQVQLQRRLSRQALRGLR